MKKTKTKKNEVPRTFDPALFGWFEGHDGMGDTSLSRLGLSTKSRAPVSFEVEFPGDVKRTFKHQYDVTSDSDDYASKYLAVYWSDVQIVHVHYC